MKTKAVLKSLIAAAMISSAAGAFAEDSTAAADITKAAQAKDSLASAWSLDYMIMDIRGYGSSTGVDLSRNIYLEGAAKYQLMDTTFIKVRYKSDPTQENEVNKIETMVNYSKNGFTAQFDFAVNGNSKGVGALGFGLRGDARYTYLKYQAPVAGQTGWVAFYPFNFDTEMGRVFSTHDICSIYSVEGAPSSINGNATGDAEIVSRTMPGLVAGFDMGDMLKVYAGAGAARYYYPAGDFSVESGVGADVWEAKVDYGWKGGADLKLASLGTKVEFAFAGHANTEETGALTAQAYSLIIDQSIGKIKINVEGAYSVNGKKPYDVTSGWFTNALPYHPVFSDEYGNTQEWVGKGGDVTTFYKDGTYAGFVKVGYDLGAFVPFVSARYLGKNFIYSDSDYFPESAERLRTADGTKSHGGLAIGGFGVDCAVNGFHIVPTFEYKYAQNKVFGKTTDIRSDSSLATRQNTDIVASIKMNYGF